MIPENVIRKIEAIVGPEHLLTSPEDCWTYAYDATDQAHAAGGGGLSGLGGGNLANPKTGQ